MVSESEGKTRTVENLFAASDVTAILHERGWIKSARDEALVWCEQASVLLGPQATNREDLTRLLALVFEYKAQTVLANRECQEVLSRAGTRDVIRALATEILSGGAVDSVRFKEIVDSIKASASLSSRRLFYPVRVVLAGTVGGGELDRVILLLDRASQIDTLAPVKSVRTRIIEFCAALD